jgi:hypothetical protein
MERWPLRGPVWGSTDRSGGRVWFCELELAFRWALVKGREPGTPIAPQAAQGGDGGTGPEWESGRPVA